MTTLNPIEAEYLCNDTVRAFMDGTGSLQQFPGLLRRVIDDRLWECRQVPGHGIVGLPNLRALVTSKPKLGWGEDPAKIEAVIRDDAELLVLWNQAMALGQGTRTDLTDNITKVKTQTGTSRAYTLSRLKRDRPDLFALVTAGTLSAHRAAITAGFRTEKTPIEHVEHWWAKCSADQRCAWLAANKGRG